MTISRNFILVVMLTLASTAQANQDLYSADDGFYGSLRLGFAFFDRDLPNEPTANFIDAGSRIGYRHSRELDSGIVTFAKIEVGVNTSASDDEGGDAFRLQQAYVGFRNDFGLTLIGKAYHTWYNTVIGPVDKPLGRACNGCIAYTGRAENGLTFVRQTRNYTVGATIHMRQEIKSEDTVENIEQNTIDDESRVGDFTNVVDGVEIGGTINIGNATIGLGFQNWDISPEEVEGIDVSGEPAVGASISGSIGEFDYSSNLIYQQEISDDQDPGVGMNIFVSYRNVYVDVGRIDRGIATLGATLGYTRQIDPSGAKVWFALSTFDAGLDEVDPELYFRAAFNYDWKM